jgi:hypothetical protein
VGAGGLGGQGSNSGQANYFNGTAGGASTVTWTDPSSVVHTLTGAGGPLNNQGFSGDQTGHGPSPQTENFAGQLFIGGTDVGANANGSPPGGAGAGGNGGFYGFYNNGGNGGDGSVWIIARQT